MRILLSLLFALLLLSSCEEFFSTTVEADPPKYEPQLVFHLLLTDHDTAVSLHLTHSIGLLETIRDESSLNVSGATVEWWQEGKKVMDLLPRPGEPFIYEAGLSQPLKPGTTYEVRVAHPDYPSVRAVQVMPATFKSDVPRFTSQSNDPNSFGLHQVDIVVNDKAGEENFYAVEVVVPVYEVDVRYNSATMKYEYDTVGIDYYPAYFDEFLDQNTVRGTGEVALISDQLFDGQEYKFQAKFRPSYYSSSNMLPFVARVRSITKEYYRWSRSYFQRYDNEIEIFSEPTPVLNNLENGLGIFGLGTEN
ncbi:MAG TPA: DUF4249 domain-containing protein [Saprospiraceae bacterium]|nr:DUF4249 domain-containing protein [Saprospiraceae bacterium]HND88239.1 DUF4249 domain-containing protein [Saprospiraceae bacterium]HNG90152.1 DUF4249 domain-containing protein [Saprospiraceae bacterium]